MDLLLVFVCVFGFESKTSEHERASENFLLERLFAFLGIQVIFLF